MLPGMPLSDARVCRHEAGRLPDRRLYRASAPQSRSDGRDNVQASLALPPIDRLPGDGPEPNLLAAYVRRARGWGGVPVDLSPAVVAALWVLFGLNLALGGWLLAVRAGVASAGGFIDGVVTLGNHPLLALVLAEICAAALVVSVPMTQGLARANGPQLGLIAVGVLAGTVALSGAIAVLVGGLLCVGLAFCLFTFIAERL
jgi:hypothetical protein